MNIERIAHSKLLIIGIWNYTNSHNKVKWKLFFLWSLPGYLKWSYKFMIWQDISILYFLYYIKFDNNLSVLNKYLH